MIFLMIHHQSVSRIIFIIDTIKGRVTASVRAGIKTPPAALPDTGGEPVASPARWLVLLGIVLSVLVGLGIRTRRGHVR